MPLLWAIAARRTANSKRIIRSNKVDWEGGMCAGKQVAKA